jgi:hypothetical protein
MQRLGYSKFTRAVRLLGREGDSLRGWWIARHTDLEDLYWSKGSPQNRMILMFAFGGGFCMWVGAHVRCSLTAAQGLAVVLSRVACDASRYAGRFASLAAKLRHLCSRVALEQSGLADPL